MCRFATFRVRLLVDIDNPLGVPPLTQLTRSLIHHPLAHGADYFMYGIKQLEIVPATAMVDAAIA